MTDTNPRDLIKLLIDALKEECNWIDNPKHDELIAKATAYLTQPEPEPDDPDYYLAWLLFACDGKLRPEAQRVLAAYGIVQPEPILTVQDCNDMPKHAGNYIAEDFGGITLDGFFTREDLIEIANTVPRTEA
jgi:hypothetical protein